MDELQTRTRIAGMQATVAQYNAALNSARARLAVLTGMQADAYSPVPANLAVEPDSLNRIDYSLIPTVLAAQNRGRSFQYGVETATRGSPRVPRSGRAARARATSIRDPPALRGVLGRGPARSAWAARPRRLPRPRRPPPSALLRQDRWHRAQGSPQS